jgi:hypothetical protein
VAPGAANHIAGDHTYFARDAIALALRELPPSLVNERCHLRVFGDARHEIGCDARRSAGSATSNSFTMTSRTGEARLNLSRLPIPHRIIPYTFGRRVGKPWHRSKLPLHRSLLSPPATQVATYLLTGEYKWAHQGATGEHTIVALHVASCDARESAPGHYGKTDRPPRRVQATQVIA